MPFNVYEDYKSRRVNIGQTRSSATLSFFGMRSFEETAEVYPGFEAEIPADFLGMLLDDYDINPVGGGFWTCEARYTSEVLEEQDGIGGGVVPSPSPAPGSTDPLSNEYSIDISGIQQKIYVSKESTQFAALTGRISPATNRLIGLTADGEIEGTDISAPVMELSISRTFGYITLGYIQTLYNLCFKTNDDTFYGFARGEVLFTGATITSGDGTKKTVNYKFLISPNVANIVLAPGFTNIALKRGHEYVWAGYEDALDETAEVVVSRPWYAVVERVYDEEDFSNLGIGV